MCLVENIRLLLMHLPLHAPLNGGCVANKSDKAIRNLNSAHNCNITPGGQVAARGDVCKPLVAVTLMTIQLSHLESTVAERSPRQAINPIFEVYYRICMQYTKIYIIGFFAQYVNMLPTAGVSRPPRLSLKASSVSGTRAHPGSLRLQFCDGLVGKPVSLPRRA